jgi:hypothetical protein
MQIPHPLIQARRKHRVHITEQRIRGFAVEFAAKEIDYRLEFLAAADFEGFLPEERRGGEGDEVDWYWRLLGMVRGGKRRGGGKGLGRWPERLEISPSLVLFPVLPSPSLEAQTQFPIPSTLSQLFPTSTQFQLHPHPRPPANTTVNPHTFNVIQLLHIRQRLTCIFR